MAGSALKVQLEGSGPTTSASSTSVSPASDSAAFPTAEVLATNLATGQIAVTTASTQVVPVRAARKSITLTPTTSVVYYVGVTGVTTTTGVYVPAGASLTISTTAAIFAVGAAGFTLSFIETY